MKGYYCFSPYGRSFLHIPYNLFAYSCNRTQDINFRLEPEFLNRIGLAVRRGIISRDRLEDKG